MRRQQSVTHGATQTSVAYACDYAGRMTNMTTWQNFNPSTGQGISGAATTTWIYHPYRGWLDQKLYPLPVGEGQGEGPTYGYTPAARLETRTWARGKP